MLDLLRLIAHHLGQVSEIASALQRIESHQIHLERKIMSLEQQLLDAAAANAAAVAGLNAKADSLIATADASAAALAALVAQGGDTVPATSIQSVIASLTGAAAAANAEAEKVSAAALADAPAAAPAPAPDTTVDTGAATPADPAAT